MTQGAQGADLDSTIAALQGGLTTVSPNTAVSAIDGWQQKLSGSGKPELDTLANDLGQLKQMLTSGNLDGKAIGALLTRIGAQTSSVASSADAASSGKLQQLGQLLSRAGGSLG